jgi:hypothetical protein
MNSRCARACLSLVLGFTALAAVAAHAQTADPPFGVRRLAAAFAEMQMPMPQEHKHPSSENQPRMEMHGMHGLHANRAGLFLMSQASGTSLNPQSWEMPMLATRARRWNLMLMGEGYLNDTQQTGPRGSDKFYSPNWFMGMAERDLGRGSFLAQLMVSLEPATVTDRRYPLLFQTGETAFGRPIVDGQHPHDLIMALGFHYAYALGENTTLEAYFAPVGDPALGPVAFPHRASAAELPQAPLGHHWQDSSHIVNEVVTVGVMHKKVRLELSGFHGAEPDENRWNIDTGAIDSWAARFSVFPTKDWMAQVSAGRLTHPEAIESGDVVRATASLHYSRPLASGNWSSSFVWGRNHRTANQRDTDSYLLETAVPFWRLNFFTARWELVDKDELFAGQPALEAQLARTVGESFRIGAYTFGYTRDFPLLPYVETGAGANFTVYTLPDAIRPFYGDHPFSVNLYLRFRLRPRE